MQIRRCRFSCREPRDRVRPGLVAHGGGPGALPSQTCWLRGAALDESFVDAPDVVVLFQRHIGAISILGFYLPVTQKVFFLCLLSTIKSSWKRRANVTAVLHRHARFVRPPPPVLNNAFLVPSARKDQAEPTTLSING